LCVYSHILSDWITNYGTSFKWPFDLTPYTLGPITVLDFTTILCFYGALTLARHNLLFKGWPLLIFLVGTTVLLVIKRAVMHTADKKLGVYKIGVLNNAADIVTWLQPSNFWYNRFYQLRYNKLLKSVELVSTINVNILDSFKNINNALFNSPIGYANPIPRDGLRQLRALAANKPTFYILLRETAPSLLFMIVYHLSYYLVYRKSSIPF